MPDLRVAIVGGGLAGCLASILMSRLSRARRVLVTVIEMRPDPRAPTTVWEPEGRSINLALSERGMSALEEAGLDSPVRAMAVEMYSRFVHEVGGTYKEVPYGEEDQCLYSVSRTSLARLLLLSCSACENVSVIYSAKVTGVDLDAGRVSYECDGKARTLDTDLIIGADGTYSRVRAAMARRVPRFDVSTEHIPMAYKELTISRQKGMHMEYEVLHVWPRGDFMLIALPNGNGAFTVTLFMDADRLEALAAKGGAAVHQFFETHFPDTIELMPDVATQFLESPTPPLLTVRCRPYNHKGRAVLIGDAAHAIVPFYGQGCNAAFEDCMKLREALWQHSLDDLPSALAAYSASRKPDADAIADLAIEHYHDMASSSGSTFFATRRKLEVLLGRLAPTAFMPLYSMITFSTMPYSKAVERAAAQDRTLRIISTAVGVTAAAGAIAATAAVVTRLQRR